MTDFRKMFKIPTTMNIRLVGAELFHADRGKDGRTDWHDEVNRHFS